MAQFKLIRDIPVAAERIEKLQDNMESIFPGATQQGASFVIAFSEYIDNLLINARMVELSA